MSHRLQVEIPVPTYFLCPISLELMRDPVTLSSGQTFDRSSIEKWLDDGHSSCPITRQAFHVDEEPIPNHVLRRMIQSWCVENRSLGIERISTPRQPASLADIGELISEIDHRNANLLDALHVLSRIAQTRPRTREHMLKAGVLSALASSLSQSVKSSSSPSCFRNDCFTPRLLDKTGETLRLLALLNEMEGAALFWEPTPEQISSLAWFVGRGKVDARQNAALVLSGIKIPEDAKRNMGATEGFMGGVLQLISEPALSAKASTGGLKLLLEMCSNMRNRVLAIEAGAVDTLVELLAQDVGKATTELVVKGMEALCGCAEGRAAMCRNTRGIEELVRTMGGVSARATKHALETLWVVVKRVPSSLQVEKRAVKAGAFLKVLAVAQSHEFSSRTTTTARKTLNALSTHLYSVHGFDSQFLPQA